MVTRFLILILAVILSCKAKHVPTAQEKPKQEVKKTEQPQQKKDSLTQKTQVKTAYNFLLMLPADLSAVFVTDSISPDSSAAKEHFNEDAVDAINFYEGALLAVDSLRHAGYDVKMKVVDLPGNEERQTTKLWIQKYENVDMAFAKVKGKPLKTLSGILSVRKIPLISCEANTYSIVEKNPYAICVQPSSLTQCSMIGAYAEKKFKYDNIIILTGNSEKEKERAAAFMAGYQDTVVTARIKRINYTSEGVAGFEKILSAAYTNTIFIPSTDEDFVTAVYSMLESKSTYRFRVIGLPVWQYFETMDLRLLEKYNTILFAAEYYTYDAPDVLQFRKKFRYHFSAEPTDEAYLGYDSFLQLGSLFIHQQLPFNTPEINLKGLRSAYTFHNADSIASENRYINIMKLENFRYVKLNEN